MNNQLSELDKLKERAERINQRLDNVEKEHAFIIAENNALKTLSKKLLVENEDLRKALKK